MEIVNSILIPYLILIVLTLSIIEHAADFRGASKNFLNLISIVGLIGAIGFLGILIALGFQTYWYVPFVVAIGGFIVATIVKSIILRIIGYKNLFVLSLLGVIGIPLSLYFILNKLF